MKDCEKCSYCKVTNGDTCPHGFYCCHNCSDCNPPPSVKDALDQRRQDSAFMGDWPTESLRTRQSLTDSPIRLNPPKWARMSDPTCVAKWIDTGRCTNPGSQTIGVQVPPPLGYADDKTIEFEAPVCMECSSRLRSYLGQSRFFSMGT